MSWTARVFAALCALALVGGAGPVAGHPVGSGPAGVALQTTHVFDPAIPGWMVVDANGAPIAITADPDNQPWIKQLLLPIAPPGQPQLIPFSTVFTVHEVLLVGQPGFPGPAWTDWHERILDPLWDWVGGTILIDGVRAPGLEVLLGAPGLPPDLGHSPDIDFFFDPIAPGTRIDIIKQIHCHGPNGCPTDGQAILIAEWPTVPEPGSLALLGMALASLALMRRRRAG